MSSLDNTLPHEGVETPTDPGSERTRLGDRYIRLATLGRGAMGLVWLAYDSRLDRKVAVKLLRPGTSTAAMLSEGRALARVSHPNVVTVHDATEADGLAFIAMEYIEGSTLRAWQEEQTRSVEAILAQYRRAANGLAAVHAAGLVHRDFKPENVMVARDGRTVVMDFGVATDDDAPPPETNTAMPKLVGTPAYLSPEQFGGHPSTTKSDQFSFCVALYEALFGQRPFSGDTVWELSVSVPAGSRTPVPSRHGVPRAVLAVLERGLSVDPAARFESMDAVDEALDRATRTWPKRLGAGLIVGSALVASVVLLQPASKCELDAQALGGVWSSDASLALRDAFDRSGHPDAHAMHETFAGHANAFVDRWKVENAALCAGTRPTPIVDAQRNCLQAQKTQLEVLLDALREPDRSLVAIAPKTAASLPSPSWCSDAGPGADVVASYPDALLPSTQALAHAQVLHRLGRLPEAKAVLLDAVSLAEDAGSPRGLGAASYRLARVELQQGNADAAEERLQSALTHAARAGDDGTLTDVWMQRIQIALRGQRDSEVARAWMEVVNTGVERLGNPPRRRAQALNTKGQLLAASGKPDDALAAFRSAVELARAHPEDIPPISLASWLNNVGTMLARAGKAQQSRDTFNTVVRIAEREQGPGSRSLVTYRTNAANACLQLQDWPRALEEFRAIERVLDGVEDTDSPARAALAAGFAQTYHHLRNHAEAKQHALEALRIYDEVLGQSGSRRIAAPVAVLAKVALAEEDGHAALQWATRLLELDAQLYPTGDPLEAEAALLVASALQLLSRDQDAVDLLRRERSRDDRDTTAYNAVLLAREAEALQQLGDREAALAAAEASLQQLDGDSEIETAAKAEARAVLGGSG